MSRLLLIAAVVGSLSVCAEIAVAQDQGAPGGQPDPSMQSTQPMNSSATAAGGMAAQPMSKMDTQSWKRCQAMEHSAMMANPMCKGLMARHPELKQAADINAAPGTPQ